MSEQRKRQCPLCGSLLTQEKYAKAIGVWDAQQLHEKHLREETEKLKQAQTRLQKEKTELAQQQRKVLATALRKQQSELNQSFQARVQAEIQRSLQKEKAALRRSQAELTKQQTRIRQIQEEAERLKKSQTRLQQEKAALAKKQRKNLVAALKEQQINLEKSFQKSVNAQVQHGLQKEKAELRKSQGEIAKQQSRMKQYEKRMNLLTQETAKQNEQIRRLKEQLARGTTPQTEGLLEETILLEHLQKLFPKDHFAHTGKGGDIIQTVFVSAKPVGIIVYECKRVKTFQRAYILQAREAQHLRNADYAVLVTNVFPSKTKHYFVDNDVFVVSPLSIEPVVCTLRESLVRMSALKLGAEMKQRAVREMYDYLSGSQYSSKVNRVANELKSLAVNLKDEVQLHKRIWRKRSHAYVTIYEDVGVIDSRLREILHGVPGQKELSTSSALALPFPKIAETND